MIISTLQIQQQNVNAILEAESSVSQTEELLSSGKKFLEPSADLVDASNSQAIDGYLAQLNTFNTNITNAQNNLNLSQSTLTSFNNLMQQATSLQSEASNGTLNASNRQNISEQMTSVLNQMVGLANTQDANGQYIYSGFKGNTQAFVQNGNTFTYQGDQGQQTLAVGPSTSVPISNSGYDIFQNIKNGNGTFVNSANAGNTGTGVINTGSVTNPAAYVPDHYSINFTTTAGSLTYQVIDTTTSTTVVPTTAYTSGSNIAFQGMEVSISGQPASGDSFQIAPSSQQSVFTSMQNMIDALNQPTTTASEVASLNNVLTSNGAALQQGAANVVNATAAVGESLSTANTQQTLNGSLIQESQVTQSQLEDLDYNAAVSNLTQQTTALQAAQQSFAKISQLTLFSQIAG